MVETKVSIDRELFLAVILLRHENIVFENTRQRSSKSAQDLLYYAQKVLEDE